MAPSNKFDTDDNDKKNLKTIQRPTWATHDVNGGYLGAAPLHYICHTTYITEKGGK